MIARGLVAMLALLVAASAAPAARAQDTKVADTIEQRMLACTICHGKQGEGLQRNEYYPRLAGKPAGYLYNQLVNYRERRREFPIMNYLVAYLSDAYLLEIAEYFSKLSPPYPAPSTRASPAVLARGQQLVLEGDPARKLPGCAACHGKTLTGMQPSIPGLVGLYGDYIAAQMGAWRNGTRHSIESDCMRDVAKLLTPDDIGAVSAYLAAQPVTGNMQPLPAGSLKLPMPCGGLSKDEATMRADVMKKDEAKKK
jgi:cytochrome c553